MKIHSKVCHSQCVWECAQSGIDRKLLEIECIEREEWYNKYVLKDAHVQVHTAREFIRKNTNPELKHLHVYVQRKRAPKCRAESKSKSFGICTPELTAPWNWCVYRAKMAKMKRIRKNLFFLQSICVENHVFSHFMRFRVVDRLHFSITICFVSILLVLLI